MRETGLPETLADTHELMPVHPLTARLALPRALAEAGLAGAGRATEARVAPGRWLRARPTLSTRTVAVTADPGVQLKLPLPVSTLGLQNRRAMEPRTLGDGALVRRVLAAAADRDPALGALLLADDGDFAHAGHPCLAYLRRRLPDGLGSDRIAPVAALLAETNGGPVIGELAGTEPVPAYFRRYLDLLFGLAVRLFVGYGIALESHQQNAAVVTGPGPGTGLRLLIKDFDGALINHARLAAALGVRCRSRTGSATSGCSPRPTTPSPTCSSRSPCTCARARWPSGWPSGLRAAGRAAGHGAGGAGSRMDRQARRSGCAAAPRPGAGSRAAAGQGHADRGHTDRQGPHRGPRHQQVLRPARPELPEGPEVSPDVLVSHALLNCLIREVSAPEDQAWEDDGHLVIRLARSAVVLRVKLRRPSAGIGPRPTGEVQVRQDASWREIGWRRLAELIAAELTLTTGTPNTEFAAQVSECHAAFGAILRERAEGGVPGPPRDRVEAYLASEQALVAGHRFHPSPKTRPGHDWLRYTPEAGARFPLRFLAVRADVLADDGDSSGLDRLGGPVPPNGYGVLPAHPWQLRLLADQPCQRQN